LEKRSIVAERKMKREQKDVLKKRASGSVALTDYYSGGNDAAYYGQLRIGTPAQEFSTSISFVLSRSGTDCLTRRRHLRHRICRPLGSLIEIVNFAHQIQHFRLFHCRDFDG
jgi:hypothetical protein